MREGNRRRAPQGLLAGVLILGLGVWWMTAVVRAGHRSAAIQRGQHATAVVDKRSVVSACLHFTCDQTEYVIRYIAEGRVYRASVIVDGWDHAKAVGSTLAVVYDPAHPGRVEVAGRAPSRTPPALGAWIALVTGALLTGSWTYVIVRRPRALVDGE